MKIHLWRFMVMVVIVGIALLTVSGQVLAQEPETVKLTHPMEGVEVSGVIMIAGTVDFPDFMKYELFLKTGNQLIWAATVYAPVIDGNLARLDTRTFPDGLYQLVVRTVKTDSNYEEYMGPGFIIANNLGAPQPYPEIESSLLYPPVAGALARIRNCSGDDLSFTYGSPVGFCSADDLWIPYKNQFSPICPYVDLLLIPCEYRGTAIGKGQPRGASYGFMAEQGKIYELTYSGRDRLYITEVKGEEMITVAAAGVQPTDAAAASQEVKPAPAAPSASEATQDTEEMLPVSGQGRASNGPFMAVASGLLLLLVVGGVIAAWKRGRPAED
ncbi:MAG: hypothetical protein JXM69_01480 [Anaerolineae bacterium]|nr:hypothetical protein [Anaerolineae bacterium]